VHTAEKAVFHSALKPISKGLASQICLRHGGLGLGFLDEGYGVDVIMDDKKALTLCYLLSWKKT